MIKYCFSVAIITATEWQQYEKPIKGLFYTVAQDQKKAEANIRYQLKSKGITVKSGISYDQYFRLTLVKVEDIDHKDIDRKDQKYQTTDVVYEQISLFDIYQM